MFDQSTSTGAFTLLALGLSSACLGFLGLVLSLGKPSRPSWKRALVLSLTLALGAAGALLVGLPPWGWFPPLCLAGVWLVFALCRTDLPARSTRWLVQGISRPRLQTGLLLLGGVVVIGWQSRALTANLQKDLDQTDTLLAALTLTANLEEVPAAYGLTDAGRRVPLYHVVAGAPPVPPELEEEYVRQQRLGLKLIQTGRGDLEYNCHGWVFAGGKWWLRSENVEEILRDNRYERVSEPQGGDLAIYRDGTGKPVHTALVRGVSEDGTILMESKWGKGSRYVHTATNHAYARYTCTYHRSPRGSHLLKLEDSPGP